MKARSKITPWLLTASGTFFLSGLAAGDLPACGWAKAGGPIAALAQEDLTTPGPPAAPSNLRIIEVLSTRILLTWTDNAANESGFRVERREGETARAVSWIETTIEPDASTYADGNVAPETEYCYRVAAFNGEGRSGYSNETCAAGPSPPDVACSPDLHGARSRLGDMLGGSDPLHVEWRTRVGLSHVDPDRLTVVAEDSLCRRLSTVIRLRPPREYSMAFFSIDDLYIITVYPRRPVMGYGLTAAVDGEFNLVKPLLAD